LLIQAFFYCISRESALNRSARSKKPKNTAISRFRRDLIASAILKKALFLKPSKLAIEISWAKLAKNISEIIWARWLALKKALDF
jgi:hypothetical protein